MDLRVFKRKQVHKYICLKQLKYHITSFFIYLNLTTVREPVNICEEENIFELFKND
jgi:hypothetical protein